MFADTEQLLAALGSRVILFFAITLIHDPALCCLVAPITKGKSAEELPVTRLDPDAIPYPPPIRAAKSHRNPEHLRLVHHPQHESGIAPCVPLSSRLHLYFLGSFNSFFIFILFIYFIRCAP